MVKICTEVVDSKPEFKSVKIKGTITHDDWITYIEDRPFNDKRYYISNEKVKQLGWTIETEFNTGIDELIVKMGSSIKRINK